MLATIPKHWDVEELYGKHPYNGPDAASVLQSRKNTIATHILYSVGRALGSLYFAADTEAEEDILYKAQDEVNALRRSL